MTAINAIADVLPEKPEFLLNNAEPGWAAAAEAMPAEDLLASAFNEWGRGLVLCTALQSEGVVLLDMCRRIFPALRVYTVDTGRLPEETHAFMAELNRHFDIRIEVLAPQPGELAWLAREHGVNAFRDSRAERHLCCQVRKVHPMRALLSGQNGGAAPRAWITGVRRDQSPARAHTPRLGSDSHVSSVWKLAPLAGWTHAQVEDYTLRHRLPRHPLYAQGYASLGCAPCTRALRPGENERAGRWWWETGENKECGLHYTPDGLLLPHGAALRVLD